jgi:hypothetical protein
MGVSGVSIPCSDICCLACDDGPMYSRPLSSHLPKPPTSPSSSVCVVVIGFKPEYLRLWVITGLYSTRNTFIVQQITLSLFLHFTRYTQHYWLLPQLWQTAISVFLYYTFNVTARHVSPSWALRANLHFTFFLCYNSRPRARHVLLAWKILADCEAFLFFVLEASETSWRNIIKIKGG